MANTQKTVAPLNKAVLAERERCHALAVEIAGHPDKYCARVCLPNVAHELAEAITNGVSVDDLVPLDERPDDAA